MPKVTSRGKWKAEVELEVLRPALSVQYVEKGAGSSVKRYLVPTDWLDDNGNVVWDVGKKVKGWLKEQVGTMKSSWKDRIQYGLVCKSLPEPGYVKIATLKDIAPARNWRTFSKADLYDLNNLPEPNVEIIQTDRGSIFAFHYVLSNPITVKFLIYCFAYGTTPQVVEGWLRDLGEVKGLGDMHNSSAGYGCFTLKSFKILEEKEINF